VCCCLLLKTLRLKKSLVFYGSETRPLIKTEERRINAFDNRMLRKTFRLKGDNMKGCWQKQHNEELHNSESSSDIIRIILSTRKR
jgi:hypothetical protein